MEETKRMIKEKCYDERTPIDEIFRGAKTADDVLNKIKYLKERARKLEDQFGVPGYPPLTMLDFQRIEKILTEDNLSEKRVA